MFLNVSCTMVFMSKEETGSLIRLGGLVRSRRLTLGYKTAKDFAAAMHITPRVLYDIEGGRRKVGAQTYAILENYLHWRTGTVTAVLAGAEPEISDSISPAAVPYQPDPDARDEMFNGKGVEIRFQLPRGDVAEAIRKLLNGAPRSVQEDAFRAAAQVLFDAHMNENFHTREKEGSANGDTAAEKSMIEVPAAVDVTDDELAIPPSTTDAKERDRQPD